MFQTGSIHLHLSVVMNGANAVPEWWIKTFKAMVALLPNGGRLSKDDKNICASLTVLHITDNLLIILFTRWRITFKLELTSQNCLAVDRAPFKFIFQI